ncbi:hypothetical protein J7E79_28970 [Bacillus sp. ISL-40]|uniref:DUF2452 domain-containing protein n=1 Tax=unclassified Bacillus (in: firmicutes) TaxID=185979 RepID=UPI001BE76810|nr:MULTISPECIES: DUF2452 domain-containing protein [unclassified Bacillus (in: firmicutes)]MBT2701297.1 hypothetical protein [Bacillus sp. ISL-40]MBT2722820.1 hypothetical protein [Bacillus sp. ISL-46]MBT2744774.1 hypothetical protein [Bacillus sp. ISL-77]
MPRQNTKDKITDIEEQIKKLKEKQKRILTNSQRDIGKYLMDTWGIEDVNEAKTLIDLFKDQVKVYSEVASSNEEQKEEETTINLSGD